MSEALLKTLSTPISGVLSKDVDSVWFHVKQILARVVLPSTGHTLDSVRKKLKKAKMQLWLIGAEPLAVAVTEIQQRPAHDVLYVLFLAGGGLKDWRDDWATVMEEYARANGCAAIEWNGRHGWNKIRGSAYRDYKPIGVTFRKEL